MEHSASMDVEVELSGVVLVGVRYGIILLSELNPTLDSKTLLIICDAERDELLRLPNLFKCSLELEI